MPPSEEAATLIRALAEQLAWFCRKPKDGDASLHLGIGWYSLCDFVADPRLPRPCSPRCQAVRTVLQLAADRLGCSVTAFTPPAPRRRGARSSGEEELPWTS
jgi:hypothetical protein